MAIRVAPRQESIEEALVARWLHCAKLVGRRWLKVPAVHARGVPAAVARCIELEANPVEFVDAFYHRYSAGWCLQKFKTPVVPMFALASPFADQVLWEYKLHQYNTDVEMSSKKGIIEGLVLKLSGETKRFDSMTALLRNTAYSCEDVSPLWVALRIRSGSKVPNDVDSRDREIRHELLMLDSLDEHDLHQLHLAAHGYPTQEARNSTEERDRAARCRKA